MVIIDFDGTIVDVWDRYYKLFTDFWGVSISKVNYIKYKRAWPDDEILISKLVNQYTKDDIDEYRMFKKNNLESFEYLKLDKIIVDRKKLNATMDKYDCKILTVRRNKQQFLEMLNFYELEFLQKYSEVITPNNSGDLCKKIWVEKKLPRTEKLHIIGDSETDMNIGLLDNTNVFFVKTGLRSEEKIKKLNIKFKGFNSINEALDFIEI